MRRERIRSAPHRIITDTTRLKSRHFSLIQSGHTHNLVLGHSCFQQCLRHFNHCSTATFSTTFCSTFSTTFCETQLHTFTSPQTIAYANRHSEAHKAHHCSQRHLTACHRVRPSLIRGLYCVLLYATAWQSGVKYPQYAKQNPESFV